MYDNLYCKMFIDTDLIYEELFELILKFVGGKKQAVTYISALWCDISVQKNKEYDPEHYLSHPDDFLYWKYYLDIEPNGIEEKSYIKNISDLLEYIKANCNNAKAACDFEDELSGATGNHVNINDDRDLAICIACKKFEEKYPKEMQPEWLKYCMFMKAARNQNKNWVIQMALSLKPKLKPNQYWHWEDDGIPVLIGVDPITQKKTIVLCDGPAPDLEVFFEVEVDLAGDRVTVHKDTDPNKLDGTKYEMNIRF